MGTRIGHYDIVAELGRGGMGVVYKGHEPALNRYVAIKMLAPALAHDESVKERFLREARSMAALNDPHIIQIYFIGENDGQPYFAMEFVEGESLSTFLKREQRMSPEAAARAIYQTALGLATAHDKGVVHRDIKPGNLMLNARGHIKIADFGIAYSTTDLSKKLTSTGEFVGTPGYLSPEVCTGQPVDIRSDIFSLGIVFFELLTGRMPFTDESPLGLMLEVVRAEIPDVRSLNGEVDEGLQAILKRMTEKDPAARYQDCHALAADLARHPLLAAGNTITARPVMSTAAQTVLAMKTPLPAAKAATPPPVVLPPADDLATRPKGQTPPPAPARPSVLEAQNQRQGAGGGALLALAAVLLLAIVGGGAWAMRDRIPFLGGAPVTTASTVPAAQVQPAATAPAPIAPTGGAVAVVSTDPAQGGVVAAVSTDPAPAEVPPPAVPTHTGIAGPGDPPIAPPADAQALEPLRRMAEQVQAEAAQRQQERRDTLAANRPPREQVAPPRPAGPPKIAVVAFGDPAITGPAKQAVEEALMNRGFLVADTEVLGDFARGDLPRILGAAPRHGVRALVVVRAEPVGQQQLNYYGQSSTLYTANLTVRPYDVETRSPLSAGIRAKVDFTSLNAETNTLEAIEPELPRVLGSLAGFKPKGQGG
ncbi:MAG: serine/threonine protein kinase [Xanthomonadaceae bacterium]|jgi:serine/threonine-protein kinase|nr:serine/threonine protein kinase [Xanthomonadaceae bacterium]